MSDLDLSDAQTWCDYHGVKVADGTATLYKAVDKELRSGHAAPGKSKGFRYPVGVTVAAPDWRDDHACGGGLHVCPTPGQSRDYARGYAKRYVAVEVAIADMRPITDGASTPKAKIREGFVAREVRLDGDPVEVSDD